MRRLATELGTGTATLYRHVPSREVILVEALDLVLGEVADAPRPSRRAGWRGEIEAVADALRAALLRHPALTPLFASSRALNGPHALAGREHILAILRGAGLDARQTVDAYLVLIHYVVGFAFTEAGDRARRDDPPAADVRQFYARLDPGTLPATVALADRLADRDADRGLAFGDLSPIACPLFRRLPAAERPPPAGQATDATTLHHLGPRRQASGPPGRSGFRRAEPSRDRSPEPTARPSTARPHGSPAAGAARTGRAPAASALRWNMR